LQRSVVVPKAYPMIGIPGRTKYLDYRKLRPKDIHMAVQIDVYMHIQIIIL